MLGRPILLLSCFLIFLPTKTSGRIIFEGSMDNVYLQILPEVGGRTVSSVTGPGVLAKTNGTFFQRQRGIYYPIGRVISWGRETLSTPGPKGQWWIIQREKTIISENPPLDPTSCICAIQGAPALVNNGKIVVSTHGLKCNPKEFIKRNCIRNIIAITRKRKLRIYRSKGSLTSIAKHLVEQDVVVALNLDGDSSTREGQTVANIVMICEKSRPCYKLFKDEHFRKKVPEDWTKFVQKNLPLISKFELR